MLIHGHSWIELLQQNEKVQEMKDTKKIVQNLVKDADNHQKSHIFLSGIKENFLSCHLRDSTPGFIIFVSIMFVCHCECHGSKI